MLVGPDRAPIPRGHNAGMQPILAKLSEAVGSAHTLEELTRPLLEMLEAVTGCESTYLTSIDWPGGMHVELSFEPFDDEGTHLTAQISGLNGKDLLAQATDVVEGFSIVFCDLKILLETGSSANLVRDKAQLIEKARVGG
jgi:hypothetical protein